EYICEVDASSYVYPASLGLFSPEGIRVPFAGLLSKQPDAIFLMLISKAKGDIELDFPTNPRISELCPFQPTKNIFNFPNQGLITKLSDYQGFDFDVNQAPDLTIVLAFLSLFATTSSIFRNINHLRYKESDRVQGLVDNFSRLGVEINVEDNVLTIEPLTKEPANVLLDTHNDHRLAIIFYMLSLLFPQVSVSETESIAKSYPRFSQDLEKLGMKKGAVAPLN
ncbi:MAG: hypothetical protein JXR56_05180, partial [Candidatus Cloacimonetes bacterium]|nr:hypothetical protein [Candidatus Cloacimonadota bacterium]